MKLETDELHVVCLLALMKKTVIELAQLRREHSRLHEVSVDGRTNVRHGQQRYTLPTYATLPEWLARAAHLRRRILVSAGLWPTPERCPLHPRVTGSIEHDDYSIENVFFESWPGFYVCGNLYRPRSLGPHPGLLCGQTRRAPLRRVMSAAGGDDRRHKGDDRRHEGGDGEKREGRCRRQSTAGTCPPSMCSMGTDG